MVRTEQGQVAELRRLGVRDTGVVRPAVLVRPGVRERGAVTAEVAMVLPMLMATMLLGLWAVGVVVANIRCLDAARDVARAVARGEPITEAERIGRRSAPADAEVTITREDSLVRVVVTAESGLGWALIDRLPAVPITGKATIQTEPSQAIGSVTPLATGREAKGAAS